MMPATDSAGVSVLPDSPRAGVCMHFSSLPTPYGIGDIGDAAQHFLHQLSSMGISVWQFLPTGPTAYGDSPYQPLSAFAGNEMLIGLEPLMRMGLLDIDELQPLTKLDAGCVDFSRLIPLKRALLSLAAERFATRASAAMKADYVAFVEEHSVLWLENYVLFRVLKARHGEKPWPQWNAEFVQRLPTALQRISAECQTELQHLQLAQFFFHQQWQQLHDAATARRIRLFGDIPIYIALDSADAWTRPDLLLISPEGIPSQVAGVPPDYFSADGQLWGNPLYDWDAHAREGYEWWTERMRHACRMNHLVRVDHFRGFESYWSVPWGQTTARVGSWERGPRDALFLAMEASLGRLPIVAENLGIITPEVEALRLRHGMPGMVVLQFELPNEEFGPNDVPVQCVCYTGTHDNDTSLGWFRGGGQDTRSEEEVRITRANVLKLTGATTDGSADTLNTDLIQLAFSTPAQLVMVPMQDFLGLDSSGRMNVPGTTLNNWRWRMRADDLGDDTMHQIGALIAGSSRY